MLKRHLKKSFNRDSLVANVSNYQVFLNQDYIAQNNLKSKNIESKIAQFLLSQHGIAKAIAAPDLKATEFSDRIMANAKRGFNQSRSGDVLYILESGWIPAGYSTGTTHGSPYSYDTHVPLLWYGTVLVGGSVGRSVGWLIGSLRNQRTSRPVPTNSNRPTRNQQ